MNLAKLVILAFLFISVSYADEQMTVAIRPIDYQSIQTELSNISSELDQAKSEGKNYTYGAIKAQNEGRVAALENTYEILESCLNKSVMIAESYRQPQSERVRALQQAIQESDTKMQIAQENADRFAGGTTRAQWLLNKATFQNTKAMKIQKLAALIAQ